MRAIAFMLFVVAGICLAQVSSTVSIGNGLEVRIGASLGAPPDGDGVKVELAPASGNSFYRIFRDQNKLTVFAYEVEVARAAGANEFQITAKPAGNKFATRFPNSDGGKPVPTLAANRELPPLRSDENAEIELFELPGSGKMIADVIEVKLNVQPESQSSGRLRFSSLKVHLGRALVSTPEAGGSVSGRYAMFYVPGRGGYFFSADAVAGRAFINAGSVDRNRMQFILDNETYECMAAEPILVNSERGEIWVYRDPTYKPEGNWTADTQTPSDAFFTAASDSLNWWLR